MKFDIWFLILSCCFVSLFPGVNKNKFWNFYFQSHDALFWSKILKIMGVSFICNLKFMKSCIVFLQKPQNNWNLLSRLLIKFPTLTPCYQIVAFVFSPTYFIDFHFIVGLNLVWPTHSFSTSFVSQWLTDRVNTWAAGYNWHSNTLVGPLIL